MDDTVRRLAKVLGGEALESTGHDVRFVVQGADGSRLQVSIEGKQQRLLASLVDGKSIERVVLDMAPIRKVLEDPAHPGRVTLLVGVMEIHINSRPNLNIEVMAK